MFILMVVPFLRVASMKRLWVTSLWTKTVRVFYINFSDPELIPLIVIHQLYSSGEFTLMNTQTDDDEHSIEMQLPYIRKIFEK